MGYYGEGHLARLRHIADLLERGFSLASMRELFEGWERGYGLARVLGFEEALAAPWDHETSTHVTAAELAALFGDDVRALAQSVRTGVLVPEGDGYRVPNPRLLDATRALMEAGLPLRVLVQEGELLAADLDRVAERWVANFREHLWKDYVRRGMPAEDLQKLTDFLRDMRPLLGEIVGPLLAQAMERKVADLTAETLGSTPPAEGRSRPAS